MRKPKCLNLYVVTRKDKSNDCDIYTALLIASDTKEEALKTRPDDWRGEGEYSDREWPLDISKLKAQHYGTADPEVKHGIIFVSYNNGC
jgi:hypothetical protein